MYFNYLTREQNEIIRKQFGPNMPGVRELETKIALMLINSHFALNGIQPKTPAAVDVGGLHIQDEGSTLQPVRVYSFDLYKKKIIYFHFYNVTHDNNSRDNLVSCNYVNNT